MSIHHPVLAPIMNAEEVASLLQCSKRTVEDHARDGTLPGVKFGDGWVFASELVVEAVKRMSLERSQAKPKATAVKVAAGKTKRLPGMAHLSEQAVSEILRPK